MLNISLLRSNLEYPNIVWSLYHVQDIEALEKFRRGLQK